MPIKSSQVYQPEGLWSNRQTAARLGVTTHYLDTMRYRKQGPAYIRLSKRRVMYDPAVVEKWLQAQTVGESR